MKPYLNHFRLLVGTLNELHGFGDDFGKRAEHLLLRLCDIFDARTGLLAIGRESESGLTFRATTVAGHYEGLRSGGLTRLLGGGQSDGILSRLRSRPHQVITAARRQIMPDLEWYSSNFYTTLVAPEGLDDCIWSVFTPQRQSTEFVVTALFKSAGARRAFRGRDVYFLDFLNESLDWMYTPALQSQPGGEPTQKSIRLPPRLDRLLTCLMSGHSEKQAARRLGITPNTVHAYVKDLYRTLNVNSRSELLAKAFSWSPNLSGSARDIPVVQDA